MALLELFAVIGIFLLLILVILAIIIAIVCAVNIAIAIFLGIKVYKANKNNQKLEPIVYIMLVCSILVTVALGSIGFTCAVKYADIPSNKGVVNELARESDVESFEIKFFEKGLDDKYKLKTDTKFSNLYDEYVSVEQEKDGITMVADIRNETVSGSLYNIDAIVQNLNNSTIYEYDGYSNKGKEDYYEYYIVYENGETIEIVSKPYDTNIPLLTLLGGFSRDLNDSNLEYVFYGLENDHIVN